MLTSYPVVAFPKLGNTFILEVDASDHAIGGVLSQKGPDNCVYTVAYFSNSLKSSERSWSTHSKEAIVMAVKHWGVYLEGQEFVIRSDHDPLVQLRKMKDPRGNFSRWITQLEEYSYSIEYIPGKFNIKADAPSRNENAKDFLIPDNFDNKIYRVSYKQNECFKKTIIA